MTIERYPLTWPVGQPRAKYPCDAAFKVEFARARDELLHGLRLMRAKRVILSTNVPVRQDGLPYSGMSEPVDAGVAVYFDRSVKVAGAWTDKPYVLACDTYRKVKWNLRAIGATVEALRSIERHGGLTLLEQAFSGFAALPPAGFKVAWWDVLGVKANATRDEIRAAYRELTLIHHPDRGGDVNRMVEINEAMRDAGAAP